MRIGITERGDAGIDMDWFPKVMCNYVDGAILITKNITELFIKNVMACHAAGKKIIVHATCTGWGGTMVEPNVPSYKEQIDRLSKLIQLGFPVRNCVLRIDPIIPSDKGLELMKKVIAHAEEKNILPEARTRISIYDEYKHVKERLHKAGYHSFYPGNQFYASDEQFKKVAAILSDYDYIFYTCAEPKLFQYGKSEQIKQTGCVSEQDLEILGIKVPDNMSVNMQNRHGCLCLSCKTELLTEKRQCPHKCIYCYWKN